MHGQAVNLITGLYLRSREGSTKVLNGSMAQMQRNKQQKGFTLIELMVTLVVAGILLALGVPSYVDWIRDSRMDTATRSLAGVIKQARSEAVSQQGVITVRAGTETAPGNWSQGAHIYTDTDANGNTDFVDGVDRLIKNYDYNMGGINVTSNTGEHVSFTSEGLLNDPVNPVTLLICGPDPTGNQITLNVVGRISLTEGVNCP